LSNTTETAKGTRFYQMKLKNVTGLSFTNIFCPRHLVQIHGIMDSSKQIKNKNKKKPERKLVKGSGWIFHQDDDPKQTSKST